MKIKTYRKPKYWKSLAHFIKSLSHDIKYLLHAEHSHRCLVYKRVYQLILNILWSETFKNLKTFSLAIFYHFKDTLNCKKMQHIQLKTTSWDVFFQF